MPCRPTMGLRISPSAFQAIAVWRSLRATSAQPVRPSRRARSAPSSAARSLSRWSLSSPGVGWPARCTCDPCSASTGPIWPRLRDPGGLVVFALADGTLGSAWLFTPREKLRETPACMVAAADYFNGHGFPRRIGEARQRKPFHLSSARRSQAGIAAGALHRIDLLRRRQFAGRRRCGDWRCTDKVAGYTARIRQTGAGHGRKQCGR